MNRESTTKPIENPQIHQLCYIDVASVSVLSYNPFLLPSLQVAIKITDIRENEVEVTPLAGSGSVWVETGSVYIEVE